VRIKGKGWKPLVNGHDVQAKKHCIKSWPDIEVEITPWVQKCQLWLYFALFVLYNVYISWKYIELYCTLHRQHCQYCFDIKRNTIKSRNQIPCVSKYFANKSWWWLRYITWQPCISVKARLTLNDKSRFWSCQSDDVLKFFVEQKWEIMPLKL